MSDSELQPKDPDDTCNAVTKADEYCQIPAGQGTDHSGDGRCAFHDPDSDSNMGDGAGAPPGSNKVHGAHMEPGPYYDSLTSQQKAWVDAVVDSFMADAPFDKNHLGKMERLRKVAIDMHKMREQNEYMAAEGVVQDKVVGIDNDGSPIIDEEENTLNLAYDRLSRTTLKELKDLGILDDPETQKANAMEASLVELLSEEEE